MNHLISNGVLIFDGLEVEADLLIREGVIAAIGRDLSADGADVIDAAGCYVMPGMVDLDAHLDLGATGAYAPEQVGAVTRQGVLGGITTQVFDFPATMPAGRVGDLLQAHARQHVVLRAALAQGAARPTAMEAVRQRLTCGVRCSMRRLGGLAPLSSPELLLTFREAGQDVPVYIHPQDGPLGDYEQQAVARASGLNPTQIRQAVHPHYLGDVAVRMAGALARACREPRVVLMPVTTTEEIAALGNLREEMGGLMMAATPFPYLVMAMEDNTSGVGRLPAGYPPLRGRHDRLILWKAIEAGLIDAITSSASLPGDDLLGNPGWLLPALYQAGVVERRMAFAELARLLTDNPAKLAGVYPRKGTLLPGADADLVIFDPESFMPPPEAPNSPWASVRSQGAITHVLLKGRPVVLKSEPASELPLGNLLEIESFTIDK